MSAAPSKPLPSTLQLILPLVAALAFLGYHAVDIASAPDATQWDLDTYYYAAQAHEAGLSPYKKSNLSSMAGEKVGLRFFYSPVVLPVLRALTWFPRDTLRTVYLGLKLLALAFLMVLWASIFVRKEHWGWLALFGVLAFDSAAVIDLHTGNISIFEQLVLWSAIALLLKERVNGFVVLIVLLASVKLTPIVFLALPLVLAGRNAWKQVATGVLAFGVVQAGAWLAAPGLFSDFISNFSGLGETGMVNPCIYSVMRQLGVHFRLPDAFPFLAFEFIAMGVAVVWWTADRKMERTPAWATQRTFLFVLTLALILPRLKDYSYLLVVLPSFWLLTRQHMGRLSTGLLVLACLPGPHGHWPGLAGLAEYFPQYQVLFVLFAIWACVVLHKART